MWIRRFEKGDEGYVAFRKSRHGPFFHALYVHRECRFVSYVPVNPSKRKLPPPLFIGKVKWGDKV